MVEAALTDRRTSRRGVGTLAAVGERDDDDQADHDRAFVIELIAAVGERAAGDHNAGLAHPVVVDAKLSEQLDEATATTELAPTGRWDGYLERAGRPIFEVQRRFNRAVVSCLHQLDHRTRAQDDRIRELEGRMAVLEDELARQRSAASS